MTQEDKPITSAQAQTRASQAARKAWRTRKRRQAALKAWETRRAKQ